MKEMTTCWQMKEMTKCWHSIFTFMVHVIICGIGWSENKTNKFKLTNRSYLEKFVKRTCRGGAEGSPTLKRNTKEFIPTWDVCL